jgi:uncharacterized protein with FMN-binding domain
MKPARPPRTLGLLVGAGALALPLLAAAPASPALGTTAAKSATYTGSTVAAHQWGTVTVNVTVQMVGSGSRTARTFSDLGGGYTYHTSRSQFIMSQALPILRQEFLAAQSARIHLVSGATYTSQAFIQSLQSALLKAHA